MNIAQLNDRYSIAGQVTIEAGKGDFPYVWVTNEHAKALISLYGGQVLSFQPQGTSDLMFVSENAYFQAGKAIKGGTPICWPWFGPDPAGKGRPNHGFVRNRLWQMVNTETLSNGATKVTLACNDTEDTQELWPYEFQLVLEVVVGEALELALITRNQSDRPFNLTQALHTYFSISDITQTRVLGLEGTTYIDKVDDGNAKPQSGAIAITEEVDRIYQGVSDRLMIEDGGARRIVIHSEGSQTAVVWNPWIEAAAKSGDLKDDDYTRFVCVETANAADDVISVPAGGVHRLAVTYTVES